MKNLILKLCLIVLYVFLYSSAFAFPSAKTITVKDSIPLAIALKQITTYYKTNFLYEELNISNKKADFNAESLKGKNVELVLTELLSPIGLKWSKIDANNYSIFPLDNKTQFGKLEDSRAGAGDMEGGRVLLSIPRSRKSKT